jgi:hypothetical protein
MPVYMIRCGEHGPVKIGYAADPAGRMADLQVAHWERLRLLRTFDGAAAEEATLHARFADLRIGRGEWFSFSRLMLADVGLAETATAAPEPPATLPTATDALVECLRSPIDVALAPDQVRRQPQRRRDPVAAAKSADGLRRAISRQKAERASALRFAIFLKGRPDIAALIGYTADHITALACGSTRHFREEDALRIEKITGIPRHDLRPDLWEPSPTAPGQAA